MSFPERIETARLVLRRPRPDDADAIFEGYAQDPLVTRYMMFRPHTSVDTVRDFVGAAIEHWNRGTAFAYAITLKSSSELMGMIDIFRVFATCDIDNIASARALEKAGLRREGLLRRYIIHPNISEEPRDSFLYAMVR